MLLRLINKRVLPVLLCIAVIFAFYTPVLAAGYTEDTGRIEIKLAAGVGRMDVNGKTESCVEPFFENQSAFIPARSALEALGAEVEWKGGGRFEVTYRDAYAVFTLGSSEYTLNGAKRELILPPRTVDNTTMLPLEALNDMRDVKTASNAKTGEITIVLENDGVLNDLSFLTGGVSTERLGDSFYKWSIDVPKGSRLGNSSFNSRYVLIENEHRQVYIEVAIKPDKGMSLEDTFKDAADRAAALFGADTVDSELYKSASPAYAEFLYSSEYNEAVLHRLYQREGYNYEVKLTSVIENDPMKLKSDPYLIGIMNSFRLEFNSGSAAVTDISKIRYGMAKYENYISLSSGKRFFSWEISVLPEWEVLSVADANPYITRIGGDSKKYLSIEIIEAGGEEDAEAYVNRVEAFQAKNFNPDYYSYTGRSKAAVAGSDAIRLEYRAKIGESFYNYDEYYLKSGSFLYCITFKAPEKDYPTVKADYDKMLGTLKITGKQPDELKADFEKYLYSKSKNRVGKTDDQTLYESKLYGWKIKLPGYWTKNSPMDSYMQSFSNYDTGGVIGVEAVESNSFSKTLSDNEKFRLMQYAESSGAVRTEGGEPGIKGAAVRYYKYRIEKETEDNYADMYFYIVEKNGISYCYMSALPDLCTSASNLKEMQDIWKSFEASGKKQQQ